jgi:hypothetical protein
LRIQANYASFPGGDGFLEARGQDDNVKIILGQERVHVEKKTLLGRKIPNLNDLGISLNNEEIEARKLKVNLSSAGVRDKMMLVCFWDMEQRPSRNCIIQLAKKAQELKAKDIVVVVVQSSQISENKLNEWIKKYKIPFNVVMVRDNVEKTRFDWGVKSLPWLILTDGKHIVKAEGFSINELNERIATLRER